MTSLLNELKLLRAATLLLLLTAPLTGCFVQDLTGNAAATDAPAADVVVSGSVGDGPVTGATVSIYSNSGDLLGQVLSDGFASFRSVVKAKGGQYPLRVVASGGVDLVTGTAPDFDMVSVMLRPSDKQVNINPFSTLMVLLAEQLPGGLGASSIELSREAVLDKLGFGLDTAVVPDPIASDITAANVAELVKASEALGEMVRRTRDLISATGASTTGDQVLAALAADLVDGQIDGAGGTASSPTVAAVASVVSGQVLVEALTNQLRVGGVVATSVIDQSIRTTNSAVSTSELTDGVLVSAQLLEQARIALAAAQVLDNSVVVKSLADGVDSLNAGITASTAKTALPVTASVLDSAVGQVAGADTGTLVSINQVVSSGGSTVVVIPPAVNTPPVITGTPVTTVTATNSYVFQPTASDSDGDSLRFSVANLPGWASFDVSTGRIAGTPGAADTGTTSGIVVSVSDGTDSVSLKGFSITVAAAPVVYKSMTLSWVPPTTRADGQPLSLSDIDGYRIYYGNSAGSYTSVVDVVDGSQTSATISNLPVGTYYVAMSTYDAAGLEGSKSAPVQKAVQ